MARKSRVQRASEQRDRSKANRDDARARRRPSRDDLARILLWQMIVEALSQTASKGMPEKLFASLAGELESQGFDLDESEEVFYALADKYQAKGNPFRRKPHLAEDHEES